MVPRFAVAEPFGLQLRPVATLLRGRAANGPVFDLRNLISGPMVVIGSAEIAHDILHAPAGTWLAGAANRRILPLLPPDTVLTLDGEAHLARRRLLAPMLHGEALAPLAEAIERFTEDEAARWPLGTPVALMGHLRLLALRVAARALFGIESRREAEALHALVRRALPAYGMLAARPSLRALGRLSPEAVARGRWNGFARRAARSPGRSASGGHAAGRGRSAVRAAVGRARDDHSGAGVARARAGQSCQEPRRLSPQAGRGSGLGWTPSSRRRCGCGLRWSTSSARRVVAGRTVPAGSLVLMPPPLIHRDGFSEPHRFCPGRFVSAPPDPRRWVPFGGGDRRALARRSRCSRCGTRSLPCCRGSFWTPRRRAPSAHGCTGRHSCPSRAHASGSRRDTRASRRQRAQR